jgi:hypothetical protein
MLNTLERAIMASERALKCIVQDVRCQQPIHASLKIS